MSLILSEELEYFLLLKCQEKALGRDIVDVLSKQLR